jgi:hypothetical protein
MPNIHPPKMPRLPELPRLPGRLEPPNPPGESRGPSDIPLVVPQAGLNSPRPFGDSFEITNNLIGPKTGES